MKSNEITDIKLCLNITIEERTMKKLKGKVALVTGAARGLGRAYALRLASLGADVGVIDINFKAHEEFAGEKLAEKYETVMDELKEYGVNTIGVEASVANEKEITDAIRQITEKLGDIDILIANAGGGVGALTENAASSINSEHLAIVTERNLYGTIYTINAIAPRMKERRTGKIITVSSQAGIRTSETGTYAHYGIAKAGIVQYTKLLAQDLGKYNITANVIAPGYIATGRLAEQFEQAGAEEYKNRVALRRFGTPEDCANVIEFLSTDLSDYVTGTVIEITGGIRT